LCEDYDLWLSLARVSPIVAVARTVSNYRLYAGQGTRNWARHFDAQLRTLRKHRHLAGPQWRAAFDRSIARVQLEYGAVLCVNGRHAHGRERWGHACAAGAVARWSFYSRLVKSYLPRGVLQFLRSSKRRLRERHRRGWLAPPANCPVVSS